MRDEWKVRGECQRPSKFLDRLTPPVPGHFQLLVQQVRMYWIRNSSAYSEPMTSHAIGGLADSRWQSWPSSWKCDVIPEIRLIRCVYTWRTILPNFIPIQFERSLRFFDEHRPNKNNSKMSSDVGSVPDPKTARRDVVLTIGVRDTGMGEAAAPPSRAKPLFLGQTISFSCRSQQPKMKKRSHLTMHRTTGVTD